MGERDRKCESTIAPAVWARLWRISKRTKITSGRRNPPSPTGAPVAEACPTELPDFHGHTALSHSRTGHHPYR